MRRITMVLGLAALLAACGYATVPSAEPTATPEATRTPVVPMIGPDRQPDWPEDVVLAVPPGTSEETTTKAFERWPLIEQQATIQAWNHAVWLHPYRPADMTDLLAALNAGRVNIAVLDPLSVAKALNQGIAITPRAQEGILQADNTGGAKGTVAGWITVGDGLCTTPVTLTGGLGYCNGAAETAPQQGSEALADLGQAGIVLGERTSFLDYLVPGDQLLGAGSDPRTTLPAVADPAERMTMLCNGQAQVTVVPLPLSDLPAPCQAKDLVVFATTPMVPGSALVTSGLPEQMAEQLGLDLAGESVCEVVLQNSACPPFWVPIWGQLQMAPAQLSYQPLAKALADLGP